MGGLAGQVPMLSWEIVPMPVCEVVDYLIVCFPLCVTIPSPTFVLLVGRVVLCVVVDVSLLLPIDFGPNSSWGRD